MTSVVWHAVPEGTVFQYTFTPGRKLSPIPRVARVPLFWPLEFEEIYQITSWNVRTSFCQTSVLIFINSILLNRLAFGLQSFYHYCKTAQSTKIAPFCDLRKISFIFKYESHPRNRLPYKTVYKTLNFLIN